MRAISRKRRANRFNVMLVFVIGVMFIVILVLTHSILRMSDEITVLVMRVHEASMSNDEAINDFEHRIYVLECELSDLKAQQEIVQSLEPPVNSEVMLINESYDSNGFEPIDELPISDELQKFTYDISVTYDIPFEALIAVMDQESNFNTSLYHANKDGTADVGIMQINSVNWKWLRTKHGLDVNDVNDNIEAGAIILSDLWNRYSPEEALSAYNLGEGGFQKHGVNAYGSEVYALYLDYASELAVGR